MRVTNSDDSQDALPAAHEAAWQAVLARRVDAAAPLAPSPLSDLYGPLCDAGRNGLFAIGHLAQSLDGRIATNGGVSQWISGPTDLLHTHRLRALVARTLSTEALILPALTAQLPPSQSAARK